MMDSGGRELGVSGRDNVVDALEWFSEVRLRASPRSKRHVSKEPT